MPSRLLGSVAQDNIAKISWFAALAESDGNLESFCSINDQANSISRVDTASDVLSKRTVGSWLYYTSCSAMVLKRPLVYNMELNLMQFASLGEILTIPKQS